MKTPAALALCAALASLGVAPSTAPAQTHEAAFVEARSLFEQAVAAVRAGRPADAVGLFERSYARRAAPVVAVNLAYCLRGLGRLADARGWYLRFLDTATPEDLARHETTVRAQLAEVSRRLAQVSAGELSPANAALWLNGAPLGAGTRWIDAGPQRAEARAPGYVDGEVLFTARAGEVLRLSTRLSAVPPAVPVTRQWWFWTTVGVAVAGVVAAVLVPALNHAEAPAPGITLQP